MDSVNKTLYIPLYGKAYVSRRGILLSDPDAEAIWEKEGFPLKGKSSSKWLSFYMGMRSAVFDRWLREKLAEKPGSTVLHLGCGLDSRCRRVQYGWSNWYDVDFPEVIRERQQHFPAQEGYHMLPGDLREESWMNTIPAGGEALIVMEGVSMYLKPEELKTLLGRLAKHFSHVELLMDCYSSFAAKASAVKNPINDVGVTQVYGLDDPAAAAEGTGLAFLRELDMTPEDLIDQLKGFEKTLFRKLYAGKTARKLYRLYAYSSK